MRSYEPELNPVVSPFVGLGLTLNDRTNRTLSLSETHLFGTRVVNAWYP